MKHDRTHQPDCKHLRHRTSIILWRGCRAIQTAKEAIISDLKALVHRGRAQLHRGSYTPQFLPIVWVIGLEGYEPLDFGVMIDAVACDESTIDHRADEIIAKLCRDCRMLEGVSRKDHSGGDVWNAPE